ncbi:MAG: glycosyltransferase family 4 protein [Muribaculaceae bacterium]|nr:glycosyltransferase family 4 protein [Muribaculaceae bacterium]MDE7393316.1 glycosyltransferase family 4 protein [Muribaculaceae bacterium]
MAKVAIFVKNLTSGGAERQATYLANLLCGHNHEAYFVIFNGEKVHQKYVDYLLENRVPIISFKGAKKERLMQFQAFLKEKNIDLVFSYLTAANFYAIRAAKGLPTKVVTGIRNARLPFFKMVADCFITDFFADATVANCYCAKDYFCKRGFIRKKMEVIPNCIFPVKRERTRGSENLIELITVARFVPQKDFATAIKAFANAHRQIPALRYTIVGYGEEEEKIRNLIEKMDCKDAINMVINPSDIPERLANADIYLSTSLFEGTSNSIMEALEAQLPVIATNVGDNSQLVKDGRNGYIVPVKDIAQISQRIKTLATNKDLRESMGKCGYDHLIKNFSPEIFVKRYNKLIDKLTTEAL